MITRETIEDAIAHVRVATDALRRQIDRESDNDARRLMMRGLLELNVGHTDLALARLRAIRIEVPT